MVIDVGQVIIRVPDPANAICWGPATAQKGLLVERVFRGEENPRIGGGPFADLSRLLVSDTSPIAWTDHWR